MVKRAAVAGVRRGPAALGRQRRTLRLMQILLIGLAVAFLVFAGYSWGRGSASGGGPTSGAREPGPGQVIVLIIFGVVSISAAVGLQARGGLRMPVPARLDELAGRAESAAIAEAERGAEDS